MPEQIYQAVWCQVFAATCVRLHDDPDTDGAIQEAKNEAEWAAANAVEHWDPAAQLAAIVHANKVKETAGG